MHPEKPNILVIMTDQHRFDTISAAVNNFGVNTPAMDSLVENGVCFDNVFCTSPVCCPSRATIATGLYPSQTGMFGNMCDTIGPLCEGLTTVGNRMQEAGYQTVYHGKSHLGGDLHNYGYEIAFENSHDPSTVTEACRYWRNADWIVNKRPFFHIVSLLNPHDIYFLDPEKEQEVTLPRWENQDDELEGKPWPQKIKHMPQWSDEKWEYYRQFYASKIEKVDAQIAELIDELFCSGYGPNTWIIFCADHGDMCGEHAISFKGPFMYDGVTRIPFIICPPRGSMLGANKANIGGETFKPFRSKALASNIDLVPTLMDIAGIEADENLSGKSLLPVVNKQQEDHHDAVFGEWHNLANTYTPIRMIRTKQYKYNLYLNNGCELYDLQADPQEMHNVAEDENYAHVKTDLHERLLKHIESVNDPFFSLRSDTEVAK